MSPAGSFHPSPYSSPRERQRKIDDVDDDKQSTLSHSSGVPRAVQPGKDALRLVAGNRVRHARCAPDFLEDIGSNGVPDSLRRATSKKFQIISGPEARTFFKNYIIQYNKRESKPLRHIDDPVTNTEMPVPIVFAVNAWEGKNKCVDYFMTWRGLPKAQQSSDLEKKIDRFDRDFRRLARVLDKEYKRVSALKTYPHNSQTSRKPSTTNPQSRKTQPPPGITVSTPEEAMDKPEARLDPSLPDPPPSAADSVMSLPLLNMVRGVPFSHRVPLRVTNPDRLSIVSEISIVPEKLSEEVVSPKPVEQNHQEAVNNTLAVPVLSKSSKHSNNDDTVKKSSASIRSSDTKSSRSSRSSSRSGHRSSRNASPGDEENAERVSRRRRKDSSKEEEPIEFVICMLGDKVDIDLHSWHGLERQSSIRSIPAERHSPWIGPLASQDYQEMRPSPYRHTPSNTPDQSDSEVSESEHEQWKHIPVVPMKPLMEAMGLIPSNYYSSPVIPGGLHLRHAFSNAGSPPPSQSPYLYSSPRMDNSPYVTPYFSPLQTTNSIPSRPPSRAYSAATYASPYMQSHTGPF